MTHLSQYTIFQFLSLILIIFVKKQWKQDLTDTSILAGMDTEPINDDEKWMDQDYIEKKLGLC